MEWNTDLETVAINVINKHCPYLASNEANKNGKWDSCIKDLRKLPEFRVAFEKCGVI